MERLGSAYYAQLNCLEITVVKRILREGILYYEENNGQRSTMGRETRYVSPFT